MRTKWALERNGSIEYFDGAEACADAVSLLPNGEVFAVRAPEKMTSEDRKTLDRYRVLIERMRNDE
jgi:hypothetical protein